MKVATLYDVHGNLPALEAVLADVPDDAVRTIAGVSVVNSGSVGMAYEDSPGAYWLLLGPGVESRQSAFAPDTGDYPVEWPSAPHEEAIAFFETLAVGG